MSARILIAYCGDLDDVAQAFAEGARPHSAVVRLGELEVLLRDEGKAALRGRLHDKVVTVFTDHPETPPPDAVIFPIYSALYHWGAVVVGPRDCELPGATAPDARLTAARYRGRRLARLAGALTAERAALAQVQL
jgi:hypothetical protein